MWIQHHRLSAILLLHPKHRLLNDAQWREQIQTCSFLPSLPLETESWREEKVSTCQTAPLLIAPIQTKSSHCRKKMKWAFFLGLEVAIETTECRIASKKEDIFNHPAHKSKQKTVTWHGTSVVIKIAKVNEHCDWEGNNWDPLRKLFIFQVSISLIIRYAKPFSNTFIKMHIS